MKESAPVICSIIQSFPEVLSAEVSTLEPGGHIRSHTGHTNERLTLHLALHGSSDQVQMRVGPGKEFRPWINGKVTIFDDSFEHEVRHEGMESRIILRLSVVHPWLLTNKGTVENTVGANSKVNLPYLEL